MAKFNAIPALVTILGNFDPDNVANLTTAPDILRDRNDANTEEYFLIIDDEEVIIDNTSDGYRDELYIVRASFENNIEDITVDNFSTKETIIRDILTEYDNLLDDENDTSLPDANWSLKYTSLKGIDPVSMEFRARRDGVPR